MFANSYTYLSMSCPIDIRQLVLILVQYISFHFHLILDMTNRAVVYCNELHRLATELLIYLINSSHFNSLPITHIENLYFLHCLYKGRFSPVQDSPPLSPNKVCSCYSRLIICINFMYKDFSHIFWSAFRNYHKILKLHKSFIPVQTCGDQKIENFHMKISLNLSVRGKWSIHILIIHCSAIRAITRSIYKLRKTVLLLIQFQKEFIWPMPGNLY